jgi:hypothetical protein
MRTNVCDEKRYRNQVSATNVGERCNVNRYTTRTHRLENNYIHCNYRAFEKEI